MITAGIRFGALRAQTRGFGFEEFRFIGDWIDDVIAGMFTQLQSNADGGPQVRKLA